MIVPSMTSKELLIEVFRDFEIVQRKAIYLTQGLRREAVKSKSKYVQRIYDYRSKQYNNWIIIVDYLVGDPRFTVILYYVDEYGLNGISVNTDYKSLAHYTPHFLARYNERFVKQQNLSKLEILKGFIQKNPLETLNFDFDGKAGQNQFFGRVKEGTVFGYNEVFSDIGKEINHFKTFINNELIHEGQVDDFNFTSNLYEKYWEELPKNIRRCA